MSLYTKLTDQGFKVVTHLENKTKIVVSISCDSMPPLESEQKLIDFYYEELLPKQTLKGVLQKILEDSGRASIIDAILSVDKEVGIHVSFQHNNNHEWLPWLFIKQRASRNAQIEPFIRGVLSIVRNDTFPESSHRNEFKDGQEEMKKRFRIQYIPQ